MVQDDRLVGRGRLPVILGRVQGAKPAGVMMLLGDYVLCVSMTLNSSMAVLYAYQGFYAKAFYWLSAFGINLSLWWMK